jgi:hypothetical protein
MSCGEITGGSGDIETTFGIQPASASSSINGYSISLCLPWWKVECNCNCDKTPLGITWCDCCSSFEWIDCSTIPLWETTDISVDLQSMPIVITAGTEYSIDEGLVAPMAGISIGPMAGSIVWTMGGTTILNLNLDVVPTLNLTTSTGMALSYVVYDESIDYDFEGTNLSLGNKITINLCPTNVENPMSVVIEFSIGTSYDGSDYTASASVNIPITMTE